MAIQFTDDNFANEVLQSDQPVLVDFWAPWCPPCRALGPTIDKLAEDFDGEAKVGKLNIDDFKAMATQYGVTSIPAVLVFKEGHVVENLVGVHAEEKYVKALKEAAS